MEMTLFPNESSQHCRRRCRLCITLFMFTSGWCSCKSIATLPRQTGRARTVGGHRMELHFRRAKPNFEAGLFIFLIADAILQSLGELSRCLVFGNSRKIWELSVRNSVNKAHNPLRPCLCSARMVSTGAGSAKSC
jgi:hypothetical protein